MIQRPLHSLFLLGTAGLLLAGLPVGERSLTPEPAVAEASDAVPHLRLERSSPAADSTVTGSPEEIRLFFSEPPQMRGTSVRLTRGAEELVASTDAVAYAEDPRQVFIRPEAPLTPGGYTVHWRVIAQDGHTQRGTFVFQVAGAEAMAGGEAGAGAEGEGEGFREAWDANACTRGEKGEAARR